MPTFTSGADTYTVSAAGTYDLDMLAGDDRLNVYGGTTVTAHLGLGNDLAILKAAAVNIFGDAGADRFDIYVSDAVVDGGADNDTINFRGGADQFVHGGTGNDRFNFYADGVGVSVSGDDGNDDFFGYNHQVSGTISGGLGSDYFNGFVAGVTLAGGGGNDIYRVAVAGPATFSENAGEGIDTVQIARGFTYVLPDNIENISVQGYSGSILGAAQLTGNALNNHIAGHNNVETINGLDGNDNIASKGGDDTIDGGNGNDYLDGGTGNDTIVGGAGADTLQGRAGDDQMSGGLGDDTYYVDSAFDVVTETSGEGTDTIRALAAFDDFLIPAYVENLILSGSVGSHVQGNGLNNLIIGSAGNDFLTGGTGGGDTIKGLAGNDELYGDFEGLAADDYVDGGSGNDVLYGGGGTDTLVGGTGDDIFNVNSLSQIQIEKPGEGNDSVTVTISGYTLADNIENGQIFDSPAFNNLSLYGNTLDNQISGGDQNDNLYGGGGGDTVNGFGGDDSIHGGAGADQLTGGSGNDTFYIDALSDSTPGFVDQITDFFSQSGEGADDQLDLSAVDADTGTAGDQAFILNITGAPANHAADLWFTFTTNGDGSHDFVFYGDVNGDGAADLEIHVHNVSTLIAADDLTL